MANFNTFIPFLHEKEGGFVHDPDDPGGATNMGVTFGTFTHYCQLKCCPQPTIDDLRRLSEPQWQDIIRTLYWDVCRADHIQSQAVAVMIVDWAVHSGTSTAIKHVQRILGVKADGIVGPVTLAAINSMSPLPLFGQIRNDRIKFLKNLVATRPQMEKFLKGWLRRVHSITFDD